MSHTARELPALKSKTHLASAARIAASAASSPSAAAGAPTSSSATAIAAATRTGLRLDQLHQRRGVVAAAAAALDLGVELVDQGCDRQLGAIAPRLVEADPQVLAHPVDREAEL